MKLKPAYFLRCVIPFLVLTVTAELLSRWLLSINSVQLRVFNSSRYAQLAGWVYTRPDLESYRSTIDVFDSITGWSPRLSSDKFPYATGTFTTDNCGVRQNLNSHLQHDTSAIRIVTIGDSFTFGEDESDENTYPAQMELMLDSCKVYNLGVHGFGLDQMLLHLRKHIKRIKPQIAVISFIAQDIDRATTSYTNYLKPMYVKHEGKWLLNNCPVQRPEEVIQQYSFRSSLVMLVYMVYHRFDGSDENEQYYNKPEERVELVKMILTEMNREFLAAGTQPVYCLIPYPNSYHDAYVKQLHPYWQKATQQICAEMHAPFFVLDTCFDAKADTETREMKEGHWRKKQNRIIAECLAAFIRSHVLGKPQP